MERIIITGTGSLAKRLFHRWKDRYDIVAISRGEGTHLRLPPWVRGEMCDIRDVNRLNYLFGLYKPAICIHTAAFKVLPLMQGQISECIKTNINGTENIAMCCAQHDVQQALLIGTDKCVDPVHNQSYGLSKAVARNIFVDYSTRSTSTRFLINLYGNVARSNHSFIPIWESQIGSGSEITITHADATRFIFSLNEAVDLIEATLNYDINGGCIIPFMPSYRITDVAMAIGALLNKPVKMKVLNKLRPGEKLHEAMLSEVDLPYTSNLGKHLCVVPNYPSLTDYSNLQPYSGGLVTSDKKDWLVTDQDKIIDMLRNSYIYD